MDRKHSGLIYYYYILILVHYLGHKITGCYRIYILGDIYFENISLFDYINGPYVLTV